MNKTTTLIASFLSVVVASFLWKYQYIALVAMLGVGLLMLYQSSKSERILFATSSISGGAVEIIAIVFGAWSYTNPTFIIPLWLLPLWGIAAVFISRTKMTIEEMEKSTKKK